MGEAAALLAAALWACASILFSQASASRAHPIALNAIKTGAAATLLWATYAALEGILWPPELSPRDTALLAASGVLGLTLGDTAFFAALSRLGARRTLLIATLSPPTAALLAWPALREPVTLPMAAGVALTVGGVAWVISERAPRASSECEGRAAIAAGVGFALLAVFGQASGSVLTKMGAGDRSALAVTIVRLAFGVAGLGVALLVRRSFRQLGRWSAPLALRMGVGTMLGTYCGIWLLVYALTHAPIGVASALSSTSPLFVLPLAALTLGERVGPRAILGAAVAVAGVALLFLRPL